MPCGSRRWPRPSGCRRAASTGTSRSPGAARRDARHLGEGRGRGRHRARRERAGRPAGEAAAPLRAGPIGRFRRRAGAPGLVAAGRRGRRAAAPGRQPAHGVPALAVRRSSARTRRTSRLAACSPSRCSSAATSSPPGTLTRPGPRCCSSRSTDCWSESWELTPARERPVLVYDGDCGFCTTCARFLERIGPDAEIVAWQLTDLAELGVTEEQAADAVQWVAVDGTVRSGHEAIAAVLGSAGRIWRIVGRADRPAGGLVAGGEGVPADRRQPLPAARRHSRLRPHSEGVAAGTQFCAPRCR